MTRKSPSGLRSLPRQDRSRFSVEAILEAATQILELHGEAGFNTNAVAARAGVSIGALYRYFPDKRAILLALAQREKARVDAEVAEALRNPTAGLAPDRAAIRAFLAAFEGRGRARRAAVGVLLEDSDPEALTTGFEPLAWPVTASGGRLTEIQAFVLSRAVHGAMRAAVMETAPFLGSQAFEDELVRLGRAYLGYSRPFTPGCNAGAVASPSDAP
jgi:AcrR family transcriptional regulator